MIFWENTSAQQFSHHVYNEIQKVENNEKLLLEFESFGPKNSGSKGLENTFWWLYHYYLNLGADYLIIDTFFYNSQENYNLVAGFFGKKNPNKILVSAHYDTKGGAGVNDNGTGVVACMEIARLIKHRPLLNGVEFIHFAAEENGLIGSKHYVQNVLGLKDTNVKFLLNLDQLGGTKGNTDNYKIRCERDEDQPIINDSYSNIITKKLARSVDLYSNLVPVISKAYGSDYVPFQKAGYSITGLYQFSDYPFYHTEQDLLRNVDAEIHKETIKASYAFLLQETDSVVLSAPSHAKLSDSHMVIYPNPTSDIFCLDLPRKIENAKVLLTNILGETVLHQSIDRGHPCLDITNIQEGIFFGVVMDKNGRLGTFKVYKH
ncbi:MAG: M28 family peptidase [Bacteroidota bacterium]|nr:M28 family peptidase [Bacteroidota bacterium]